MELLSKFASRKLVAMVIGLSGLVAVGAYAEAAAVVVAYLTAQGVVDVVDVRQAAKVAQEVAEAVQEEVGA
ncbi:MAG TPA: hypothetical protein VD926_07695 [Acidimicrobiales bacterium]|nr:hypothetical protein [Acidimicrobiales bacterium]